MKNFITAISLITISVLLCYSCVDENVDDNSIYFNSDYPHFKSVVLSDTKAYAGVPSVKYTETYEYNTNKRLTALTYQQNVAQEVITISYDISYNTKEVIVSGDNYLMTYHLGNDDLPVRCSYKSGLDQRLYLFEYTQEENFKWLNKITEEIDNKVFSEISFPPINKQTAVLSTTMHGTTDDRILTLEVGNVAHLPNPYLLEIHPLSMHKAAFYARLFGPMPFLINKIEVPILNETTQYRYDFDSEGMPEKCIETITSQNQPFQREVKYSIEKYD